MMAVEAVKENFYCFLGIVHPTYYQSRGWGPWLVVTYHWCPAEPRTLLLITFGRTTFLLPITIYQLLGGKTSSIKLNEPFECLVFIKTCFMWFNGVEICINCQSWSRSLLQWRLMGSRGLKLCIALKLGLLWTFISNSCTPPYQPPFACLNAIYMDYKVVPTAPMIPTQ